MHSSYVQIPDNFWTGVRYIISNRLRFLRFIDARASSSSSSAASAHWSIIYCRRDQCIFSRTGIRNLWWTMCHPLWWRSIGECNIIGEVISWNISRGPNSVEMNWLFITQGKQRALDSVPFRHSASFIVPQSNAVAVQRIGKSNVPLIPSIVRNLDRIICRVNFTLSLRSLGLRSVLKWRPVVVLTMDFWIVETVVLILPIDLNC